jgi:hypothetical protein
MTTVPSASKATLRLARLGFWAPLAVYAVSLLISFVVFGFYFPNPLGLVGHDFSLTHPALVDGAAFFWSNPLFAVPWFTPSFCGGQPFFADPQSVYFSPLQWLALFLPPTQASFVSLLMWQSVAYWGFYLFARSGLGLGRRAAIVGSVFAFANTFIADRMIVGEVGYGAFALFAPCLWILCARAPWAPFMPAMLPAGGARRVFWRLWSHSGSVVAAGLVVACMLQSGLTTLMIPTGLGVLGVGAIASWRKTGAPFGVFLARGALASLLALLLCASKVNASLAFMTHFPRDSYTIPGLSSIWEALAFPFLAMLFDSQSVFEWATPRLVNVHWAVFPHEWAYSFGWPMIAVILFGLGGAVFAARRLVRPRLGLAGALYCLLLAALLLLPGLLLWGDPGWNAVMKSLPLLKSSSWPFRWICGLIPLGCAAGALCWGLGERLARDPRVRWCLFALAAAAILSAMSNENRVYYWAPQDQNYNPARMDKAWEQAREGKLPPVSLIQASALDANGHPTQLPGDRNDALYGGVSFLECYNPAYGYRLEAEPLGRMRQGPVNMDVGDGRLNLKNPACLVWPGANPTCSGVGDEWRASQAPQAELFSARKPFDFSIDARQKHADSATRLSLAAAVAFVLLCLLAAAFRPRPWLRLPRDLRARALREARAERRAASEPQDGQGGQGGQGGFGALSGSASQGVGAGLSSRQKWAWAFSLGAVFAVCAFAFWPSLSNSFVWDDLLLLADSSYRDPAQFWSVLGRGFLINPTNYWRPLGLATLLVQIQGHALAEAPAMPFHLVNLLLASANAVLAGALGAWIVARVRRAAMSPWVALACGLLYGLHPALHEEVYWISSRFDLMANLFFFSALLVWAHAQAPAAAGAPSPAFGPSRAAILFGVLTLLACLSKDTAPLYLGGWAILAWVFGDRPSWARQARFVAAGLAAVGLYMLGRVWALGDASSGGIHVSGLALRDGGWIESLRRFATATLSYLRLTVELFSTQPLVFSPSNVVSEALTWATLAAVVLSMALLLWLCARRRVVGSLLLGFWWLTLAYAALQAFAGFTTGTIVSPRYLAFPLLFVPPLLVFGAQSARAELMRRGSKSLARVTAMVMALPLACYVAMGVASAHADALVWKNEVSLWSFANDLTPGNSMVMANLSKAYSESGRADLAEKALAEWFRTQPMRCSDAALGHNYAAVLMAQGKLREAYDASEPWIASRCYAVGFLHNYSHLLVRLDDCDDAIRAIDELPAQRKIAQPQDPLDVRLLRVDRVAIAGYCRGPQAADEARALIWPHMDEEERRGFDLKVQLQERAMKGTQQEDARLGRVPKGVRPHPAF